MTITVAVIARDDFEDSELTSPVDAVRAAGAEVTVLSPEAGTITGKHGTSVTVDATTASAQASDFDALILPGGTGNADLLRLDDAAVALARDIVTAGKPVAAICHGGWLLTDADVLRGRTVTSFPSLRTDLRNAGATWVDEEVHVDGNLITSRTPDDLPAFNKALVAALEG